MAQIVYINGIASGNGGRILSALAQIRDGLGTLHELDGLRAESIGAGQAAMGANFGIENTGNMPQAMSDRWGGLLAAFEDTNNAEFAKLRDIINATTQTP